MARDGPFEVFGQPLIVGAKQQGTATFDYVLPASVAKAGSYRLTWLRQPGTGRDELRATTLGRSAQVEPGARSLSFASPA